MYDRASVASELRRGRALQRTTIGTHDGATRFIFLDDRSIVEAQLHESGRLRALTRHSFEELERVVEFFTPSEVDDDWFATTLPTSLAPLIAKREQYDARVTDALARDDQWLPLHWKRNYLRRSSAVGLESISVDDHGAPSSLIICYDQVTANNLDAEFFEQPERMPEPVPAATLSALRDGERAYATTLDRLHAGIIGWRIHLDLLVVWVDDAWYNTEFVEDGVTSFTRFNVLGAGSFLDTILTASTTGRAERCIHPVTPQQIRNLRERVGQPPDEVLAKLSAGEIELLGGGPTSDMVWSLARVGDRYVQRGDSGEQERTAADVERIVRERRYHSTRAR